MTTKELFDKVSKENADLDPRLVKKVCQSVFSVIRDELIDGGSVSISSFGIFETKIREQRNGFNPRTHETLVIPAKRYPTFRASKTLKETVSK